MKADDEQQLLLRIKEGNNEAFRLLVERYMKQAYNIAYGFVNNHDEAEDLAQESFVNIYRSIHSFRGESAFSTWLYRIVMNLSLNHLRQRSSRAQREIQIFDESNIHLASHSTHNPQPDVAIHIERALHELPTLQRAVVILRHINGLSTKQVSGILRCSEGTIKTHLHRGLKKMRTSLHFLKDEL